MFLCFQLKHNKEKIKQILNFAQQVSYSQLKLKYRRYMIKIRTKNAKIMCGLLNKKKNCYNMCSCLAKNGNTLQLFFKVIKY